MNRFFLNIILLFATELEAQNSVLSDANRLFATGNYSKAIEAYKSYDKPSEVYESIAKSYKALGNFDAALSNYSKAAEAYPDNVFLKFEYAKLLYSLKKYKESVMLFNNLVENDSLNPNYHYELGTSLEALNDSTAINQFHITFDLDKTHQKAIYKIARDLLIDRKHEESLKYIEIGLDSYENNIELISLKAQNLYWKQDYREAAKWFEKLIELGESSQFIHESLSFCYAKHYNYKNAAEQGLLALQYDPKNFKNLFIQGQLYEGIEDFPKAEEYMTLALSLKDAPLDAEYSRLGYVLNRQGKYKEAIEALNKALKFNPNNETTQFYLLMAKDKSYKDVNAKLKMYEDFQSKNPKHNFNYWVERRIKELKEEKFIKGED